MLAGIRENEMMKFISLIVLTFGSLMTADGQHARTATFSFPPGGSIGVPFTIGENLILISASVNDKTGIFIFDTGAETTVVDGDFSSKVGLRQSGRMTGTGAAGTATAGILKGGTLTIGGLTAHGITLYSLDLAFLSSGFGLRIDGVIGNDVIKRTVAEIDYANTRLTLYKADTYKPNPHAEVLPLTIKDGLPFIETEVTPIEGRPLHALMEIDTGSTGAVLLNAPFVQKNKLLASLPASIEHNTGGVGGTGTSKLGRIAMMRFGSSQIARPIAVLYTGTKGDNASSAYDGLIGGGVFRRFKMTVDISGRHLYMEPGPNVGDPFDMDMSGLELVADGPDLKTVLVDDVRAGSAAAAAGIEGDDVIVAIDGKPVSQYSLDDLRRMLRRQGAQYDVTVSRKGRMQHFHLVLKREI